VFFWKSCLFLLRIDLREFFKLFVDNAKEDSKKVWQDLKKMDYNARLLLIKALVIIFFYF
jgi:hypothetical protein